MSYRNRWNKTINYIWIICVMGSVMIGCGYEHGKMAEKRNPNEKVLIESAADMPQLAEVEVGDIKVCEYYDGEVNPHVQILQFPQKGVFVEFCVSLGDTVSKEQLIACTEPVYEKEIEESEELIASLQTDYANTMTNYDLQAKTNEWKAGQMRSAIESMDSDMPGFEDTCISFELLLTEGEKLKVEHRQYAEKMEKEIAYQQKKLERLREKNEANRIVAPADGRIIYLADLKVGDEVNVNTSPVAVADESKLLVQCEYVTEAELEDVEKIYALKDGEYWELEYFPYEKGELERRSAKGEGLYSFFECKTPKNPLSFGEDVKIVMVKEIRENVLIVPENCIHRDGASFFVYREHLNEREAVTVEIGLSDGLHTEILSGIKKGDKIYVSN